MAQFGQFRFRGILHDSPGCVVTDSSPAHAMLYGDISADQPRPEHASSPNQYLASFSCPALEMNFCALPR